MEKSEKKLISDVSSCKFERVQKKERNPFVLCTLRGPCMEINKRNRNNRVYSEQLIRERIVENADIREKMKNRQLLGEGDHPEERTSISYPMVALAVVDLWIPDDDKEHLWGEFDILPTTKGKDLAAIVDYAGTIGISARALGSHYINSEGAEVLEASDYDFITFDAVPDPGFASARLTVKESLERDKDVYTEKSIKEIGTVLESYRSFVQNKSQGVGLDASCGSAETARADGTCRLPKSVIDATKRLQENLRVVTSEREKLRSEKRFLLSQVSELRVGLDSANTGLTEEKKRSLQAMKRVNEALAKSDELAGLYRKQMKLMSDDIDVLRNRLHSSETRLDESRSYGRGLAERCASLEDEISRVDGKAERLRRSLSESKNAGAELAKDSEQKSMALDGLEAENLRLKADLDFSNSELRKKGVEAEKLSSEIHALKRRIQIHELGAEKDAETIRGLTERIRSFERREARLSKRTPKLRDFNERRMARFRKENNAVTESDVGEKKDVSSNNNNQVNEALRWMKIFSR